MSAYARRMRTNILIALGALAAVSCSPADVAAVLPVVRSVADLAQELCAEGDDALACVRKCEAAAQRRACECGMLTDEPLGQRCAPCD